MQVFPFIKELGVENMATDWWLLEQAAHSPEPSFRHYAWKRPEISFGYGQDWKWVEKQTGSKVESLVRRPTGGGIVRHGEDWTYCLVIPRAHESFNVPSLELYQYLHDSIAVALKHQSVETFLQPCPNQRRGCIPGDCFHEPVGKDLMEKHTGKKIAGAAMKKTKGAILIQGTMERKNFKLDQDSFLQSLLGILAELLSENIENVAWPDHFFEEREKYSLQFKTTAWLKERKRN